MAVNESIVTGRKFRKLIDEASKLWQRISFWTKSNDVEFDDGKDAETKVGAIDGITDSLVSTSSRIAASAKAVNTLSNNLMLRTGRRNSENKYTNKFCIGHCIYGQGLVFEINTETSPRFLTVEILNDNGIWESSWVTGEELFYGSIYITCNVPSSNVTYGKSYLIRVTTQS